MSDFRLGLIGSKVERFFRNNSLRDDRAREAADSESRNNLPKRILLDARFKAAGGIHLRA